MIDDGHELARVRGVLLLASAIGWALLLIPGESSMHATHSGATAPLLVHSVRSWALMLLAMMPPVLILPVYYLRIRSFRHRHTRTTVLFVAAYATVWMVAAAPIVALTLAVTSFAAAWVASAAGLLVAIAWQCSPAKQRCLNRCHAHPEMSAFGATADFDALRLGAAHGVWCAGSCWALMLLPTLVPVGHLAAMAIVTVVIASERLERARPPRWEWRGPGKAFRIVIAQARMRRTKDIPASLLRHAARP